MVIFLSAKRLTELLNAYYFIIVFVLLITFILYSLILLFFLYLSNPLQSFIRLAIIIIFYLNIKINLHTLQVTQPYKYHCEINNKLLKYLQFY